MGTSVSSDANFLYALNPFTGAVIHNGRVFVGAGVLILGGIALAIGSRNR